MKLYFPVTSDSTWMKATHSSLVGFVCIISGTQSMAIEAINSSEDTNLSLNMP